MEFLEGVKEEGVKEEGFGHVLMKDIIENLERDFGKGGVIVIRISILNVHNHILNLFIFRNASRS